MRRINAAILNPWFAAVFAGTPLALLAAAVLHLPAGQRGPLVWLVAALVLVLVVIGVTMGVNVPLNNAPDSACSRPLGRVPGPSQRTAALSEHGRLATADFRARTCARPRPGGRGRKRPPVRGPAHRVPSPLHRPH